MKIEIIKLGSKVTDRATGLKGTLTHLTTGLSNTLIYSFQPDGLNKDTRCPLAAIWAAPRRVAGSGGALAIVELPTEVLGTDVKHEASGFTGMAVGLTLHLSGCVHVEIQPKGQMPNGSIIPVCEFDVRQLTGKAIPKLTEKKLGQSLYENPSPSPMPPGRRA